MSSLAPYTSQLPSFVTDLRGYRNSTFLPQNEVRKRNTRLLLSHLHAFASQRLRCTSAQLYVLPERRCLASSTSLVSSTSPQDPSACSQRPRRLLHSHATAAGMAGLLRTNKTTSISTPPALCKAAPSPPPCSWTQERATWAGLCPTRGISSL